MKEVRFVILNNNNHYITKINTDYTYQSDIYLDKAIQYKTEGKALRSILLLPGIFQIIKIYI